MIRRAGSINSYVLPHHPACVTIRFMTEITQRIQWVELLALRPNNWYLNQAKLDRVRQAWRNGRHTQLPPILITTIDQQLSLIDGHSRAFAAYERGQTQIQAEYQTLAEIGGSEALYRHIHQQGPAQGIHTIADLASRILPPNEHKRRWSGYCNDWLAENES